ncbi:hypothetical protein L3V82_05300 [Thiotrichales bacterium 19S3-7]|nr:hypothetical protein [Thiotrichales bacterium 19S3-7]MCF6801509.1 hypothetical protein [Thiotrichales bacterium 19S3-11]
MSRFCKLLFAVTCLILYMPLSVYASCNASVKFNAKNYCPWPVDFKTTYSGSYSSKSFSLESGGSYNIGERWETTITVTDSYGDAATVWIHSKYTGIPICTYYYDARNVDGYDFSHSKKWTGSAPTVSFIACQDGAKAKIKVIGLGKASVSKNGLLQSDNTKIKITGNDTYKISFTATATYCTFKLNEGIYCSQNDVGAMFTTGNLIFACQQVDPKQGQCGWANQKNEKSSSYINVF